MKTLIDVARRLEGMAQNAADRAVFSVEHPTRAADERDRVVEFLKMAEIIHNHIAQCQQSQ